MRIFTSPKEMIDRIAELELDNAAKQGVIDTLKSDYQEDLNEAAADYKQDALRYRKLVSLWQDEHFNPAEFEQNLDAAIKGEE